MGALPEETLREYDRLDIDDLRAEGLSRLIEMAASATVSLIGGGTIAIYGIHRYAHDLETHNGGALASDIVADMAAFGLVTWGVSRVRNSWDHITAVRRRL